MINQPLVSICIPHFNNKNTISQTLDSLLSQTYQNIVIKVFDNVSDDGSWEIVKEYAEKYSNIRAFQNSENIGGEANFTECIQGLEGKYGAIYHADDLYHPLIVETQVKYLLENDISAVFVRANIIDDRSENIGEQFFPNEIKENDYYQLDFEKLFSLILKYDNFLITPSVMARVDLYQQQVKSWNGKEFKTSADLDVWLRFSLIKDVGIITKKLISYRLSKSSYSYRVKFTRILPRDMFLVTDYYLDKYKQLNFNLSDYQYLMFKDNIIVISNRIFNGNLVKSNEIKLGNLKVISRLLFSKQKTKVYIYALLIKIGLYFNANKILLKFVALVNKIPNSIK
jgi:glycosyltransferase involved in cell wall biosynthesis